jgi:uncharacterized protein YgfB (UPF0149 family)
MSRPEKREAASAERHPRPSPTSLWDRVQAQHRAFDAMRAALDYDDAPTGNEIVDEHINMQLWFDEQDRLLREAADALASFASSPLPAGGLSEALQAKLDEMADVWIPGATITQQGYLMAVEDLKSWLARLAAPNREEPDES